jgi:hypothetical protein
MNCHAALLCHSVIVRSFTIVGRPLFEATCSKPECPNRIPRIAKAVAGVAVFYSHS